MARITTTKQVHAAQIIAALRKGCAIRDYGDRREVDVEGVSEAELQATIDSLVYDADAHLSADEKRIKTLAAKSSLTNAEAAEALRLLLRLAAR